MNDEVSVEGILEEEFLLRYPEAEKIDNGYKLILEIPFIKKESFDLFEGENEIIIKIGNFKRNVPLPEIIKKYDVTGAKLEGGKLEITFS